MNIFLQRHGESVNNVSKIFSCRKIDTELSENGIKQIKEKIEFYREIKIDKIISSSSKRAIQTSEILSKGLNLNYMIDSELMEVDLGDLEGQSEIENDNLNYFFNTVDLMSKTNKLIGFPHGESNFDINKRIESIKNKYLSKNESFILVGHATFFAFLISKYNKYMNIRELFLKRGSFAKFNYKKDIWTLHKENHKK